MAGSFIPPCQEELPDQAEDQNAGDKRRKVGIFRMQDLLDGFPSECDPYIEDDRCHHGRIDILQTPVSERMLCVGWFCGIVEGHHEQEHRAHISDVIEAIPHDREETALPADEYLHTAKDKVHGQTDQPDKDRLLCTRCLAISRKDLHRS